MNKEVVTLKFPTEEVVAMAPMPDWKTRSVDMVELILRCFNNHYKIPDVPEYLEPETWVKNYIKNNFD